MRRPAGTALVVVLVVGVVGGGFLLVRAIADRLGFVDDGDPKPTATASPEDGKGGKDDRDDDERKAPEVLPAEPFAGERTTIDLPEELCREDADSAEGIEAFLAQTPNGTTVVFPEGARCRIDRSLELSVPPPGAEEKGDDPSKDFRAGMVYDLNGATLFRPVEPSCERLRDCNGPMLAINLAWDVVVKDGSLVGGTGESPSFDATMEHDHGVAVHGASLVKLEDLRVARVGGDCVDMDRQKRTYSHMVEIRGGSCEDAARQGISANETDGLVIEGVAFDRIFASGIDLEPRRSGFLRNVRLEGNTFGETGHYAIALIGASPEMTDVVVVGNEQTSAVGLGFIRAGNGEDRGPVTIEDNRSVQPSQVKHFSGSATGNVLTGGRGASPCLFTLINAPSFEVSGNDPADGMHESCTIDADYAEWDGLFALRDPSLLFVDGAARIEAEYENLEDEGCTRSVTLVVSFRAGGDDVGSGDWSGALGPGARVPITMEGDATATPDAAVVTVTAGDCAG
jgi:hypothetical protein